MHSSGAQWTVKRLLVTNVQHTLGHCAQTAGLILANVMHRHVCACACLLTCAHICMRTLQFVAANRHEEGAPDAAEGSSAGLDDPLTVLSTCKEYVISKSGPMANRHYLDAQKIANRVWTRHFMHRKNLRGKVLETFEQLSTLTDIMAAKVKTSTEQLERSKANEKFLQDALGRVERQRRVLQQQVEARGRLVRDMCGVPRKARDTAAAASTLDTLGPGLLLAGGGDASGRQSPAAAALSSHPQSACFASHARATGGGAAVCRQSSALSQAGDGTGCSATARRPTSAPQRRSAAARAPTTSRLPEHNECELGDGDGSEASSGTAPRRPLSARMQHPQRSVRFSGEPMGEHWCSFKKRTAPGSARAAPGALFSAGSSTAHGVEDGSSADAPRWLPPSTSRISIEASFLSRLGRAA